MRSVSMRISQTLGILMAGLLGVSLPAHAQAPMQGYELVDALKKGGYIIYFRHGATDHDQADQDHVDYTDPNTQRNLSEKGQNQARLVGRVMKTLDIPVGDVISSPYCRCIETGHLAFGKATPSPDLAFAIRTTEEKAHMFAKALKRMLGTPPDEGTNTVLIAHSANLKEAANIWPKPEGIVVVFKPGEKGDFSFVGLITPDQWGGFVASTDESDDAAPAVERSVVCGPGLAKYADSSAVQQ